MVAKFTLLCFVILRVLCGFKPQKIGSKDTEFAYQERDCDSTQALHRKQLLDMMLR